MELLFTSIIPHQSRSCSQNPVDTEAPTTRPETFKKILDDSGNCFYWTQSMDKSWLQCNLRSSAVVTTFLEPDNAELQWWSNQSQTPWLSLKWHLTDDLTQWLSTRRTIRGRKFKFPKWEDHKHNVILSSRITSMDVWPQTEFFIQIRNRPTNGTWPPNRIRFAI